MSESPAISVVIPLYNKGPYIARALNSVLAQTFQDFEVIVVDDGSTDDGASIVKDFEDSRIRLIQQENRGVSAARNNGARMAQAAFITFLDADDEWSPNFLETVIDLKEQFPKAGAYSTAISISYKGVIKPCRYRSIPSQDWQGLITDYFRSMIMGDTILCSSSVALSREIFDEMNGFLIGAKWGEDLDLWGRIAMRYPICFSSSYCVIIHTTNDNIDRLQTRVNETVENPFIKSAAIMLGEHKYSHTFNIKYLDLYVNRILVQSAVCNAIIGQNDKSEAILRKCKSNTFFFTRALLQTWCSTSKGIRFKTNRNLESILFTFFSYLQLLELRVLSAHIE